MGSPLEINDTLKLTPAEGLPPSPAEGQRYTFRKAGRRLYHLAPTRVFLVEDRAGTWNFIGHALVVALTIDAERDETRGTFVLSRLYPREYAQRLNLYETPPGKACTSG
ncbi:MAG: hypothetical protein K8T26_16245 [Lentisphaerae bacterium]|nr:hypothetical protein [Lentisphaerota bacterium]